MRMHDVFVNLPRAKKTLLPENATLMDDGKKIHE